MTAVRCRLCDDLIESRFRHDLAGCSCGEIFVDGGPHYLRIGTRTDPANAIVEPEVTEEYEESPLAG